MLELVNVPIDGASLEGNLVIPPGAQGIVLFAHGSGSSRHSPRNRFVADVLRGGGVATLLIDLLTAKEEQIDLATSELRFDIGLLTRRVVAVIDWLAAHEETRALKIGLFGSSTGAAAALQAAAERPNVVGAVVSRGGRPDLAADALRQVVAPTLLIVGGADEPVLGLNRSALAELRGAKRLDIVPGATHLFEEPGALEDVARRARGWFECYLAAPEARVPTGEPAAPGP